MTYANLPCGCIIRWDKDETTVMFCDRHVIDYVRWDGSDVDFIKMLATPRSSKASAEIQ